MYNRLDGPASREHRYPSAAFGAQQMNLSILARIPTIIRSGNGRRGGSLGSLERAASDPDLREGSVEQ